MIDLFDHIPLYLSLLLNDISCRRNNSSSHAKFYDESDGEGRVSSEARQDGDRWGVSLCGHNISEMIS